jgi:hypothetical protein
LKNYPRDFAKRRFNKDIDALPERAPRILQHSSQRLPNSGPCAARNDGVPA